MGAQLRDQRYMLHSDSFILLFMIAGVWLGFYPVKYMTSRVQLISISLLATTGPDVCCSLLVLIFTGAPAANDD